MRTQKQGTMQRTKVAVASRGKHVDYDTQKPNPTLSEHVYR